MVSGEVGFEFTLEAEESTFSGGLAWLLKGEGWDEIDEVESWRG